jgi:hypothetical protein
MKLNWDKNECVKKVRLRDGTEGGSCPGRQPVRATKTSLD